MQMERLLRYSRQIRPDWVVPMAGPPCFLDDEFFDFNDFGDDPANVFPDQTVYLDYMRSEGADTGRLIGSMRGTVSPCEYGFIIEHALVEQLIKDHEENLVDRLFLSCRFEAERKGAYKVRVQLPQVPIGRADGVRRGLLCGEQVSGKEFFDCAGYLVQRRCPHMKGDLRWWSSPGSGTRPRPRLSRRSAGGASALERYALKSSDLELGAVTV
jgi:hypothetical protein